MKRIVIGIVIVLFLSILFISGCITEDTGFDEVKTNSKEGILQLLLTDKPGELDIIYANVTISTVQVHISNGENDVQEENNNIDDETGFSATANGKYEGTAGQDIQFLGSAYGGEEPYIWSWDFGDGNTSVEQNPIHNYSINGTYDVTLTVLDNKSETTIDTTSAIIGENTEDDPNVGWFTIVNESRTFDLIQLLNISELLGEKTLETGKYTQIRLTVESAIITINKSGIYETHTLTIPSNKVKMVKTFWINENETTILTLDFDVYKSVHQTGNNRFIMKPTIQVIQN